MKTTFEALFSKKFKIKHRSTPDNFKALYVEDTETESLYRPYSDDGLREPVKKTWSEHWTASRFTYMLTAAYILLTILYIILWIDYSKLRSRTNEWKPNLFPCMFLSFFQIYWQSNAHLNLSSYALYCISQRQPYISFNCRRHTFCWWPEPRAWSGVAWSLRRFGHSYPQANGLLLIKRADTTIRVAKEDLDYYNVTSLPLADGSGFASEIFMTHELHCLVSHLVEGQRSIYLTSVIEESPTMDLQGNLLLWHTRFRPQRIEETCWCVFHLWNSVNLQVNQSCRSLHRDTQARHYV